MGKKERIELNETDKDLLHMSAGDLIPLLESKPDIIQVKQMAFEYYSDKTKEFYQVQVIVTREDKDFLGAFDIEETKKYGK